MSNEVAVEQTSEGLRVKGLKGTRVNGAINGAVTLDTGVGTITVRFGSGLDGSSAGAGFAVDSEVAAVGAAGATALAGDDAALGSGRAGARGACRIGLPCASTRGCDNCRAR